MPVLTNQRWEIYCQNWFSGKTKNESAIIAGFAPKWAASIGTRLSKNVNIRQRYAELQAMVASAKIATVQERMERLSEITRAKLTDFMELGQDGSWVNIGKETPGGGAIQEIHSRTEHDEDGSKPTVYTSVKLHDPIKAIDLLNKMDKLYSEGTTVNIDNRRAEIVVMSENTKKLVERVLDGEGTVTR